jgi:GST-like protein
MITLFTWPTPNGQRIQIMLEELNERYDARPVNILRGEQFESAFLKISPNNKIPAITDSDVVQDGAPLSVFETGAILIYLAEKFGKFFPTGGSQRAKTLEWLLFQCSSLGPMLGQATHFRRYARQDVAYAVERYTSEATRLYRVVERQLERTAWIAGDDYSIADMATFPWICRYRRQGQDLAHFPRTKAWLGQVSSRPAVTRGMELFKDVARETPLDDEAHQKLFGKQGVS